MRQTSITYSGSNISRPKSLEADDALLFEAAHKATGDAYAPYSKFRVGAAVRLSNGQIITGSNQENASFPAGICAERVALSAASASFPAIAVTRAGLDLYQ